MLPQLTEEVKIQSRGETAFHLRFRKDCTVVPSCSRKSEKLPGLLLPSPDSVAWKTYVEESARLYFT